MDRRQLLASGAAIAALLPAAGLSAQEAAAAIDEAKIPALQGGAFAMMSSQLALEKSQNENVRAFAELEVAEQEAVKRAFGAEGAEVALREDHAAMMEQLQGLEGAEFDAMYLEGQIAGHEELRGIHADYAESGEDPMARGASMVGVTGIDTHLVMLRSFQAQLQG